MSVNTYIYWHYLYVPVRKIGRVIQTLGSSSPNFRTMCLLKHYYEISSLHVGHR